MSKNYVLIIVVLCFYATQLHAQLQVANGTTFKLEGNATLVLQDMSLVNNGTFNQTAGTVRFTGTANNTIGGTQPTKIHVLQLAKTGTAEIQLQRTIGINTLVSFTSGLLNLNNNNLELEPAALLTGETETTRVIGANGGHVQIVLPLNAPSSANPGNLGAVITSAQNLGTVTIRRGHTAQNISVISRQSINRYYDITPTTSTSLNATLRFNYFNAELNGRNEALLSLWRSNDNINWTGAGFSSRDATSNFVQQTGIASFSRWTLTDIDFPTNVFDLTSAGAPAIKVWPNPTVELLNISVRVKKTTDATVSVIDMQGRRLMNRAVKLVAGNNQLQIETLQLAAGAYQLIITAEDGSTLKSTLIRQ
ncbi:T9SS type A sorting domain-containing protein [Lacibacter sp. H407]|uniref:T9SS type A sorting domain-containing protein n=1 Tax=Lacibacter sp. H407 TaxID=3133423 RepID=UPI0030BB454F